MALLCDTVAVLGGYVDWSFMMKTNYLKDIRAILKFHETVKFTFGFKLITTSEGFFKDFYSVSFLADFVFVDGAPISVTKFSYYIKFCNLVDWIRINDILRGDLDGELEVVFVGWDDVHKNSCIGFVLKQLIDKQ
jgi:hypothetical protein